ncbi:hypothetical protein PVK06_008633 [Gossypium arboreum]|uniref:Uncharacterized protein n=1 Tax=Gossypium arboreum TaxID=29729 RepID=A0ABR0QLB5_GOSAR|nr:hypothetical protein PVK06_008633 [Gossypium arboreum]
MDIKPSYNCLLGRPWIHSPGTVPSSLHQKLKLVTDGRLITINAEEDIIAAVTSKAPYVESHKDGPANDDRDGSIARKGLGRQLQGGVQIPKLIEKKDRFGLGFKPDHKHKRQEIEKLQARRKARLNGGEVEWEPMTFPSISKSFKLGGLLVEESHQINAVHNEGLEQGSLKGIRPYELGSSLNNWTAEDLPMVFSNFSE